MPTDLLAVRVDRVAAIIQDSRNRGTRDRLITQALLEVGTITGRELIERGTDNAYARGARAGRDDVVLQAHTLTLLPRIVKDAKRRVR